MEVKRLYETYNHGMVDWAMMFAQIVTEFEHSGKLTVFEDSSIKDIHDVFDDCADKFDNDPEVFEKYNYFHDYAIDYILRLQRDHDNKNKKGGGAY